VSLETIPFAVRHFAERLAETHNVSLLHGALMLQSLYAAGWEPNHTHYSMIPDGVWAYHERKVVARKVPRLSFKVFPMSSRLPDRSTMPASPLDAMVPVLFFAGEQRFIVPYICDSIETRDRGTYFMNLQPDFENNDAPYVDEKGAHYADDHRYGGEALLEYLIPPVEHGDDDHSEFDNELRKYVFAQLAQMAEAQVIQKFYADWGDYVRQYEEREEKQKLFDEQIRALRRQIYWMRDPYSLDEFDREFSAITSVLDERDDLSQTEKFKVAVDRMGLVVEMLKPGSARSVNSEYH
jgi:hypothetical protein